MAKKTDAAPAAPATQAPAAPAPAPAAPSTPAAPDPIAASTVDSVAEPASNPFESFDWDGWDGESEDPFPEDIRPWISKVNGRYKDSFGKRESELSKIKEIYDSIITDQGDPRVSEFESKVKELEDWRDNAARNFQELLEDRNGILKAIEEQQQAQAEQEAIEFQNKHAWIFDGGEKQHTANELFDEGFPHTMLPELLKLPAHVLSKVREHHKTLREDGVQRNAAQHALALAKAMGQPPPPSESATLISGAAAPNPGPTTRAKPPSNASLEEKQVAAVRRAMAGK